eukprot:Gb_26607 [translate_table: standard]
MSTIFGFMHEENDGMYRVLVDFGMVEQFVLMVVDGGEDLEPLESCFIFGPHEPPGLAAACAAPVVPYGLTFGLTAPPPYNLATFHALACPIVAALTPSWPPWPSCRVPTK